MSEDTVRVGLLGCGHVGSAVVRMLHDHAEEITRRSGARIDVARVAVRDSSLARDVPLPPEAFTADAAAVAEGPDVDVVAEVMGGVEPARSAILAALSRGRSVVTANKELLAAHGPELFAAAAAGGADLLYEAAVGGGIPLIRPLRESLAGDRIVRFLGIVNGTTNFVLTRMSEEGWSLEDALAEAKRLGFAEADPSADIEGHDAAAKAAILASIAFDLPVAGTDVYREGITGVGAEDIGHAHEMGYVVKLLAMGEADGDEVSVRVHPAMIPAAHPLASVRDGFNAVYLEGERVGPLMLYGQGAGGDPTATAVVGDLIELARDRRTGDRRIRHIPPPSARRLAPFDERRSQYYLRLRVADKPGVLASIALVFAHHEVSIKSVRQEGSGDEARIVLITHQAVERALQACVRDLRAVDAVAEVSSVIRVEAGEP
jgi:homoserine dehydrogenase